MKTTDIVPGSKTSEIVPFEELKTSTRTIVVYSNIEISLIRAFMGMYITPVDVPLTSKKKNVDRKKLTGPYGAIISVQKGNLYRGVNMRRNKTHWCTANCRRMGTTKTGKQVKLRTVVELSELVEGTDDIYNINYYCTECERYYTLRQLGKNTSFLNQTTVVLALEDIVINIMVFRDTFKVAGCKTDANAIEAIRILWEDHIQKLNDIYDNKAWALKEKWADSSPKFLFRPVMRNMNFRLAFYIDREKLNMLMNRKEYKDIVFMSQCETTGNTNVNIKMYTEKPDAHRYECLTYPNKDGSGDAFIELVKDNYLKDTSAKKPERITLVVFSTSEVILSGRYPDVMKERYEFFIKEMLKNRKAIEEKIVEPQFSIKDFIM